MSNEYEVFSPWAEADRVPASGITPRVSDLAGKKIGLFCYTVKPASTPIIKAIETRLRERFPSSEFSRFEYDYNKDLMDTPDVARFNDWVKGVDAAIAAVGD
ncbi:MAG: hypothetical protein A2W25_15675 [candidate division Zixibacteria bacterium RBG_16_53_22]|nr:MAG: hypothetical protein A2W25_15675 [candidate division Zixibacteria bacterium RBG_16_53_22]HJX12613.1 hypothetical protein [Dehalococcoidales bacterium]